ncbi:hypothetical protein Purlil1_14342 [Purpureocillium lilacinum]|uniref:Methyltransferase domain-containing protein n=1 Tax=Purpureocillium lilacinum TaxID=33203 RepID=A0ABR0BBJ9_PURLI|nr:hypothetical protein Purlil1_14342 [Purpureocillium lilacinum]
MESLGFNGQRQDPTPSEPPWYLAYGRYYGKGPEGQKRYLLPIDAEELDRLDMLHKFFLVVRNDALCAYNFNLVHRARVLDLGTGTGIWAIELCKERRQRILEVVTVDINPIFLPYWYASGRRAKRIRVSRKP